MFSKLAAITFGVCLTALVSDVALAQSGTVVVNFDSPSPPGPGDALDGVFQGINFGSGQWRWEGPYGADPTNNIYFASSSGTARVFTFSTGPQILVSIRAFSGASGTLTISDNLGQGRTQAISAGSIQLVTTGWTQGSTTVTVSFTSGWELGVDDITYRSDGTPDTTPPTVAIISPAQNTTVSGVVTVSASASDDTSVVGVQFKLNGLNLGPEVLTAPYSVSWDTTTTATGVSTLSAVARDPAGNLGKAMDVSVTVSNGMTTKSAIRFHGYGVNDIDRIKIRIDDPSNPAFVTPPVNVGATDFTIEFWVNGLTTNNAGSASCGATYGWITGNIVYDRDRFNQGRAFGISFSNGSVAFGAKNSGGSTVTVCGTTNVLDGTWHHVAVQRRFSDGMLWIFVDGMQDATPLSGAAGDVSYHKGDIPTNDCGGPCTNSDPFIVIGAEKHDAGPSYPSFNGFFDELRISNNLRYTTNFARPSMPFVTDGNTMGLYHFDEGTGINASDSSGQTITNQDGVLRVGGNPPSPQWVTNTPF